MDPRKPTLRDCKKTEDKRTTSLVFFVFMYIYESSSENLVSSSLIRPSKSSISLSLS